MNVRHLISEAVASTVPGATTGTIAALAHAGDTNAGWFTGRGLGRGGDRHREKDSPAGLARVAEQPPRLDRQLLPPTLSAQSPVLREPTASFTAPPMYYSCTGTGKRGVFDRGICARAGKLTGPTVNAHADSFPWAALRFPRADRHDAAKRTPVIRTRRRRRRTEHRDCNE